MDDIIFEKDYRETESAEYDKWCDEVFDRAVNCGMLKAYSEAMDKIPKIIVPEDKKNYEYLLERCDAFVKQHRGYIKGIVDYHRWHAEINMFLPFAEFDDSEDLAFLKEIAEKSQTVCFSPEEEGGIRVHIFINYFEELMSAEHKSYIEYDAIMQDKKLSELLGIPELSDEEIDELDISRYMEVAAALEQLLYGVATPYNAVMLADYDGPAIQLGTGGISGPTEEEEDGKGSYYAPNSYIYFGLLSGGYWTRTRPTMEQQAECSCCRSICWHRMYSLDTTNPLIMLIKAVQRSFGVVYF